MSPPNFRQVSLQIKRCYAKFSHVTHINELLNQLLEQACAHEEPDVLLIIGDPGVGKSSLLQRFARLHPRIDHETWTEVPVVYVEVPAKCTLKRLPGVILKALGSPLWNRGDEEERTFQLETLLAKCRTRLIILDEVNHLIDRGRERSHYLLADYLKQLIDRTRVPVAMAGIPRAKTLLAVNEQLADRVSKVIEVEPFGASDSCANQIVVALRVFERCLDEIERIDLTSQDSARRFAIATGGRLRAIRRLLVSAVEIASGCKRPRIDYAVLSEAFKKAIYPDAPPSRNPFNQKAFDGRPLTQVDEPFYPRRQPKEEVDV